MDVVVIKWADAHSGQPGWHQLDQYDDQDEEIVTTVGFHTPEGSHGYKKNHVTVWQTMSDGDGFHPFHIPVGMVRNITILCSLDVGVE